MGSRVFGLLLGLLACLLLHLAWRAAAATSPWPAAYLRWSARCLGLRILRAGAEPIRRHVLIVANHVSWLDIVILGAVTQAAFVSRDDVARWPLIGWLAGLNGTIYVARGARRQAHGQADALRRALASGRAVALFPEGTTEGGHELLPFRPALFASLLPPLPEVAVQPVAIDYGAAAADIAWVGEEPALANARRILARPGSLTVMVTCGPPIDPADFPDRKRLSAEAETEVRRLGAFGARGYPLYGADEEQESPDLRGEVVRLPDERL